MLLRCTDSLSVYLCNDFNALRIEKRNEYTFKANWAGECNLKWLYAAIRRVMGGRAPPGGYGDIYTYSATHGVFKTSDVT